MGTLILNKKKIQIFLLFVYIKNTIDFLYFLYDKLAKYSSMHQLLYIILRIIISANLQTWFFLLLFCSIYFFNKLF